MISMELDSENDVGEINEDWYRDSDTSEDIPEPNTLEVPLYQDRNSLPTPLKKKHFELGVIFTMTMLKKRHESNLVMIIEGGEETFVYRIFFARGSSRKTFHQGLGDKTARYKDVWRLAPRRELSRQRDPSDARVGETLRFTYGMSEEYLTAIVISRRSNTLECKLECGMDRGAVRRFEIFEMVGCTEMFGSSILQTLLTLVKDLQWVDANSSKTCDIPPSRPELHIESMAKVDEQYKRKFHFMKILGTGAELLCSRTNARAKYRLSKSSSEAYKKRWKDLNQLRFSTFMGVHLGVAILGIGSRHQMRCKPS